MGNEAKNANFQGLRRRLERAPLMSRGKPTGRATLGQARLVSTLLLSGILIDFYHSSNVDVVVVLTLTRIIKSVVTGQVPVTLELRNTPGKTKHKQTKSGTRLYHS